ncbi:MAG: LysR family transcriptional regulator [Clostridia bacterium]|nr:LysR family transcriptional regulator [Clostridia bacterium]
MDFQRIECFLAVAHHLNFSRAAKQLYMAQPSVTQQIKNMEDELGFRLLERDRRGVSLTSAGKTLQDELIRIMTDYKGAINRATQVANNEQSHITLGYPNPPEWSDMPGLIREFRKDYPHVTISLRLGKGRQLMDDFQAGELDVMFGDLGYLSQLKNTKVTPLFRAPAYVLVPNGHPLDGAERITPSQINHYGAYCLSADIQDMTIGVISRRMMDAGIDYTSTYPVLHREDVVASVYAGMGLGIVPGTLRREVYQTHVAILDAKNAFFEFGCVRRTDRHNVTASAFIAAAANYRWIGGTTSQTSVQETE